MNEIIMIEQVKLKRCSELKIFRGRDVTKFQKKPFCVSEADTPKWCFNQAKISRDWETTALLILWTSFSDIPATHHPLFTDDDDAQVWLAVTEPV